MVKPMKSANFTFGGKPSKKLRDTGPNDTRSASARTWRESVELERGRWASCGEIAPPQAPIAAREAARPEEPRTGVVRRMHVAPSQLESGPLPSREPSGKLRVARPHEDSSGSPTSNWRCLEWGQSSQERRPRRDSKVTIVQLSPGGDLLRQNGPATWLPDAGDFVHRMSRLVAQGLGFDRCRALYLRSSNAVLTVAEAGDQVIAVSGPVRSMTNVLRRAGLE
jgi:hypothetical protein